MLSREQNALLQFKLQSTPFQEAINATGLKPLIALNNTLIDAAGWFGIAEHHARQAERFALIKEAPSAKQRQLLLKRHNETGLQVLSRAQAQLDLLTTEFEKDPPAGREREIKARVARSLDDLKTIVADFETKPSDVEKIAAAIDEVHEAFKESGHGGIIKLLQKKFAELEKVRARPDRGAIDNIPVWKAVAIIVAVGIWVAAIIHCGWFECSVDWALAYAIGFNIAALIAYFC